MDNDPALELPKDAKPLFHIETTSKNVGVPVFINVYASSIVAYPPKDYDEVSLCAEVMKYGPEIPNFKMPYSPSPVYWSVGVETPEPRSYVTTFLINDRWAMKILKAKLLLHSTVSVIMLALEKIVNNEDPNVKFPQRLGHRLDLDFLNYKIHEGKIVKSSKVLVDTKVIEESSSVSQKDFTEIRPFDLHYRPKTKVLTCSIECDRVPDSIGFNEERIIVRLGDAKLIDTYLPIYIDLKEPMRYKYDERLSLFRAVFKVKETL